MKSKEIAINAGVLVNIQHPRKCAIIAMVLVKMEYVNRCLIKEIMYLALFRWEY